MGGLGAPAPQTPSSKGPEIQNPKDTWGVFF